MVAVHISKSSLLNGKFSIVGFQDSIETLDINNIGWGRGAKKHHRCLPREVSQVIMSQRIADAHSVNYLIDSLSKDNRFQILKQKEIYIVWCRHLKPVMVSNYDTSLILRNTKFSTTLAMSDKITATEMTC